MTFTSDSPGGKTRGSNKPAFVCLASLTENKDGAPTRPSDQRRAGGPQSDAPVAGELQRGLPAPTQAGRPRRHRRPLARLQPAPVEVRAHALKEHHLHAVVNQRAFLHIAASVPCRPPNYEAINNRRESRRAGDLRRSSSSGEEAEAAGCDLNLAPVGAAGLAPRRARSTLNCQKMCKERRR